MTFGIVLDKSELRRHRSFLCVIFTASFLVLSQWFKHSLLGVNITFSSVAQGNVSHTELLSLFQTQVAQKGPVC